MRAPVSERLDITETGKTLTGFCFPIEARSTLTEVIFNETPLIRLANHDMRSPAGATKREHTFGNTNWRCNW